MPKKKHESEPGEGVGPGLPRGNVSLGGRSLGGLGN